VTRDEYLHELQRRIAREVGYTDINTIRHWGPDPTTAAVVELQGVLYADEGPTLVPRWPWDWCAAWALIAGMRLGDDYLGITLDEYPCEKCVGKEWLVELHGRIADHSATGSSVGEAISRCWLAWQGVDLSDLPPVDR
jgi:hypothetical protein